MDIGWPQLIYMALGVLGLGTALAKHGEARGPFNAWHQIIAIAISWPLLWWGGFFH